MQILFASDEPAADKALSGTDSNLNAVAQLTRAAPTTNPVNPLPDRILVKFSATAIESLNRVQDQAGVSGLSGVDMILAQFDVKELQRTFPHLKQSPAKQAPELSRLYTVYLQPGIDAEALIQDLNRSDYVEYAERIYPAFTDVVPNDPYYSLFQKPYFDLIDLPEAWDIEQGDDSVVVAIIDTGVDWLHEDLCANIWVNIQDTTMNGIDEDGNGYTDDAHGWDFVDVPDTWEERYQPAEDEDGVNPDNDPMDFEGHGTHCAGITSAVTNNGIGVAGVGWNTTIMPIRVGYLTLYGDGVVSWGYEGIVYAAENGADIVSLSWGGSSYSQAAQEVIDYVWDLGVVIIAAAGNESSSAQHYPAAYNHVVAVGATEKSSNDLASFSNYGTWLDICAPGVSIISTVPDTLLHNSYNTKQGTSMSAPMVAGAAALVKAYYPAASNHEIVMKLSAGANSIDSDNPDKAGLLGYGQLNVYQALTTTSQPLPNIRLIPIISEEIGNGDQKIDAGETIRLTLNLENLFLGGTATNITANLTTDDYAITLDDNQVVVGDILPLDSLIIQDDPFVFTVEATSIPHRAVFTTVLTGDSGYEDTLTLELPIGKNPILLVDDDDGANNVEQYYIENLDSLGMPFAYWSIMDSGTPTDLSQYSTLIWLCEWSFPSLMESDRSALGTFLDNGGKLFLSGQDIGWDLCANTFDPDGNEYGRSSGTSKDWYETYLHSVYLEDDATTANELSITVTGVAGNPIGDGLSFDISQPGRTADFQFPSIIDALEGAENVFQYPNGEAAATLWSGNSRIVNFAYGYEAITDPEMRFTVMERTLKWLNDFSIEHESLTNTKDTISARIVTANVHTATATVDSIAIYWSLDGNVPFNIETMTAVDADTYSGSIPAQGNNTEVHYFVFAMAENGFFQTSPPGAPLKTHAYISSDTVLAIPEMANLPRSYTLRQNYPNPFNPTTVVEYSLPEAIDVRLDIYDLRGQLVKRLVDENQMAGEYAVTIDATGLPSGIYFYQLQTTDFSQTKKMLILK